LPKRPITAGDATPIAAAPARNARRSMAFPLILLPVRSQRLIGKALEMMRTSEPPH
jgi:hypothetical protein